MIYLKFNRLKIISFLRNFWFIYGYCYRYYVPNGTEGKKLEHRVKHSDSNITVEMTETR